MPKILFVWPNKDAFGFKPIGLSLLSATAKRLGWQVGLFDTTRIDFGFVNNTQSGERASFFKPVDMRPYGHSKKRLSLSTEFTKSLETFGPDCVAVSILSDEYPIAREVSRIAKKHNTTVVWGGKYPTLNPKESLEYADFVCVGEGLEVFKDFLMGKSVPRVWNGPLKKELDDLPYVDWDIFDEAHLYKPFSGKAYRGGDHMLNWGCPYDCTYCINNFYHGLYGYGMRRYGVSRIVRELKHLKEKHSLEFFRFHDEDFLLRLDLGELSAGYKKEVGLPFSIETNPKSVTRKKAAFLKEMNCVSVSLAIETGDRVLRKMLGRVDTEEEIMRAFSLLNEFDIRTVAFNLLGIPFETEETYRATVELNKKANPEIPSMGFFFPYEGTKLREIAIRNGFFKSKGQIYRRDKPALEFPNLTEERLVEMCNNFVREVKG